MPAVLPLSKVRLPDDAALNTSSVADGIRRVYGGEGGVETTWLNLVSAAAAFISFLRGDPPKPWA